MSDDELIPYDLTSGCQHFRPDLGIGESWTCPECGWIWFGMAPFRNVFPRNPPPQAPPDGCRVYWGTHGCDHPRGHPAEIPHECDCCTCGPGKHPLDPQVTGYVCVAKPPYYGPETTFYGEEAEALGLPPD